MVYLISINILWNTRKVADMLEFPEIVCLRNDIRETAIGKCIAEVYVDDMEKYANTIRHSLLIQPPEVFKRRLEDSIFLSIDNVSQTLLLTVNTGYILCLGAIYGSIRYHTTAVTLSKRNTPCLQLKFTDESYLSVTVNLFGIIRVFDETELAVHLSKRDPHLVMPDSENFNLEGFRAALARDAVSKVSVKKLLTSRMPVFYVDGLGGGYIQEILYRARLYPKRKVRSLSPDEQEAYYNAIKKVTADAIQKNGRWNEIDLFGQSGGFIPHVCRDTLGKSCPVCGTTIIKFRYEGGACYVCPGCQPAKV
jgi:formamidopyrimidine-DNA glycosylase